MYLNWLDRAESYVTYYEVLNKLFKESTLKILTFLLSYLLFPSIPLTRIFPPL